MPVHVNSGQLNAIFREKDYIANEAELMFSCTIMKLTSEVLLQLAWDVWKSMNNIDFTMNAGNIENLQIQRYHMLRNMFGLVLV